MMRKFTQAYLLDPRPRRAAIQAGYPIERASVEAQKLLKHPTIARIIKEQREELADQFKVTSERIVQELALLAFSNMGDYTRLNEDGDLVVDLSNTPREHLAAIQEITSEADRMGDEGEFTVKKTKIKLMSKREALVDLGKTLGLFGGGANEVDTNEMRITVIGGLPNNDTDPPS